MNTTSKIKHIIADEYKKIFSPENIMFFKKDERILSRVYHGGKISYFNSRLFELKKEALNSSMYGRNWVEHDCFEVDYIESFEHITRECELDLFDTWIFFALLFHEPAIHLQMR